MASEDVIELGSSEDEAEAAPKRRKPPLNAMVHIPIRSKLPGLTIKPANKLMPMSFKHGNLNDNKINVNGKAITKTIKIIPKLHSKPPSKNVINPVCFNTLNLVNKLSRSEVIVQKVPTKVKSSILQAPNLMSRSINNLPSGITIKKTIVKRKAMPNVPNLLRKKQKLNPNKVLMVDLDDDSLPSSSSASPQWYLRPEEQIAAEEENNKEPEGSKMIEITIEDSPVKSIPNKRTHEVGAELSITIDDSPIKPVHSNNKESSGSDSDVPMRDNKKSKKQLKYTKVTKETEKIEIEVEMNNIININTDIVSVVERPKTPTVDLAVPSTSSPKKNKQAVELEKVKESPVESKSEFHPVYQSFIDLCFELENSDDMKKIVEKKIITYYKQVPTSYTESEEFIDFVSSKIISMKAGPDKMYLYIKDVVDELNLQRKMAKSQESEKVVNETAPEESMINLEGDSDSKRQRQIRKLEKTLKKLHRAIQKLEEQEVDFEDDEDSVYLLTDKYKYRMIRVHAKLCELTNSKMPSEPRLQLDVRPGRPKGPAKKLEKWINKKVPVGTPLPFPDFHDVLRCVREANQEDNLKWSEAEIMEEARDLFTRCGRKLQRRRQENEWRLAVSRLTTNEDPAENNEDLKKVLENNRKLAAVRETEILNKYADRQNHLKLEGEEIGDKEAEESPVESEDDEAIEDTSALENKDKRKARLKRLFKETRTSVEEKENNPNPNIESETKQDEIQMEVEESTEIEQTVKEVDKSEEMQIDNTKESEPLDNNTSKDNNVSEEIHQLSDDSNNVESDIDELHLLQKIFPKKSNNEVSSTLSESSDSESPISLSDSLSLSGAENEAKPCDVISIENSSYSESETKECDDTETIIATEQVVKPSNTKETECSNVTDNVKIIQSNNDEYNDSIENILLASSDDEVADEYDLKSKDDCVNLVDDDISIGETVIENKDKVENKEIGTADTNTKVKDGNSKDDTVSNQTVFDVDKKNDSDDVRKESSEDSNTKSETNDAIENIGLDSSETNNINNDIDNQTTDKSDSSKDLKDNGLDVRNADEEMSSQGDVIELDSEMSVDKPNSVSDDADVSKCSSNDVSDIINRTVDDIFNGN